MAYITTEDLRQYFGVQVTTDDSLMEEAIEDAQEYIESQTNRRFRAVTETRYYGNDSLDPHDSTILHLDTDLISVTTLTNGDASSTVIAAASYVLLPRNDAPPYHQIQLLTNVSDYWEFDTDYWVSVLGAWGYSTVPPHDIRRACTVLAAYYYRQKDAQQFDVTAVLESGALVVPQGIPATVDRILERYKRYI
jgi:hypothetical protein